MGEKLVQKPEGPIPLSYALELGWPLTDAIYSQLSAKNMGDKYWVKGVYTEGGEIFCILENYQEGGGYFKCSLSINDSDSVTLNTEGMTAVKMTWSALPAPATGGTIYNKEGEPAMTAPVTTNPALHSAQPEAAPAPAPAPAGDFAEDDDKKCEECGNDPCTCEDDKENNSKHSAKPAPAAPDYQTMYNVAVAKNLEYETQIAEFKSQIAANETTITSLNSAISGYRAQIEQAAVQSKDAVMAEYKAVLTEEEFATVTEYAKAAEVTGEMVETKCAVLFTKRAKTTPAGQFQLNVSALPSPAAALPDYMKQALEMEAELGDPLALKA